jgi:hypothetical protein
MIKAFKAALAGIAAIFMSCAQQAPKSPELTMKWKDKTLFDLPATALDGKPYDLGALKGKVVLVVNVASECGFTGQYEGLESLWKSRKDKGLVILGAEQRVRRPRAGRRLDDRGLLHEELRGRRFPCSRSSRRRRRRPSRRIYEFLGTKTGSLPGWNFCRDRADWSRRARSEAHGRRTPRRRGRGPRGRRLTRSHDGTGFDHPRNAVRPFASRRHGCSRPWKG